MSWLAWRLHGIEVRLAAALAALVAALVVASRLVLASGAGPDLRVWAAAPVLPLALLVIAAPAVLGMFLGAPLVAGEVERGTHRLAWTQSVSRRRWFLVHVGLVLGSAVVAMAVIGAAMLWGMQPLFDLPAATPSQADGPLQPGNFDAIAAAPAAYAAFAIALGAALGSLTRRTLVAMFLVLVLFTLVRVGIGAGARPNYEPPLRALQPVIRAQADSPSAPPGAYVVATHMVDPAGHDIRSVDCRTAADCAGYGIATDYQPSDRFWTFQLVEAGIYLTLTALLLALTYWRVVRRLR